MVKIKIADIEAYGPRENGNLRRVTVADSTQFSQGLWLYATDSNTGLLGTATTNSSISAGPANVPFSAALGWTFEEKNASNGITEISVFTDGVVEAVASGAIEAGEMVMPIGESYVISVNAALSASLSSVAVSNQTFITPQYMYAQNAAAANAKVRFRMVV